MADATKLPTLAELTYFQWATPDSPNPRLSAPIDSDDTTISFTSAPLDETRAVITAPFLMGVKNADSYVETIYCPNGADGASGLSATGCIRGIDLAGLDFTVGDTNNADSHDQDSSVFCNITGVIQAIMLSALQGTLATGGTGLILGTDANGTVTISHSTGTGTNAGFLRYNNSTSKAQFSNDGTVWNDIDDVAAGSLVVVTGADSTPSNLEAKITARGGLAETVLNPGANEALALDIDLTANTGNITAGVLADVISDVGATSTEIDQALDGISANVTDTNLNTLTAGSSSDADALHTHPDIGGSATATAGEAIDGSSTPQFLSIGGTTFKKTLRIETAADAMQYGAVPANNTVGGVDASTRVAQSFTYTDADAETITIDQINLMVGIVNSPGEYLHILIETDDSDKPSNTVITNGTSAVLGPNAQISETGKFNLRAFTFPTPPTIVSGTKYWIVLERCDALGAPTAINGTDHYAWARHGSSLYAGHGYSTQTGTTTVWAAEDANDMYFDMRLNVDYDGQVFKADANNLSKCKFIGVTSSNVADAGAPTVQPSGVVTMSGLTPGATYYASTTPGAITTTPSGALDNCLVPVGEALSTTQLLINRGMRMSQYLLNNLQFTSDNAGAGVNIQTFIETGFKPQFIRLALNFDGDANQYGAGRDEWIYGSEVPDLQLNALDASNRTVTIQTFAKAGYITSGVGFSSADRVTVGTIYENGFGLNVVSDSSNHPFPEIYIVAYGY